MANTLPEHIGLDFGNHTVKAVEIKAPASKNPKLVGFGSKETPFGVLNSESEIHVDRLSSAVKAVIKEAGIKNKNVIAAIPESVVSTRITTFKGVKEKELNQAVYWDAKQSLPVPIEEMHLSWMPLAVKKEDEEYLILRVAATRKTIRTYTKVIEKAGLNPLALETEGIAIARMVGHTGYKDTSLVLDFGSQTTDMSVVKDNKLLFSQSISTGSDALTRAIMNEFSLEYNQAEQYKRKYGIVPDQLEGKIYKSLEPLMKVIIGEVVRGTEFYKSKTGFAAPKTVFLVGDGSLLPGLVSYLTKELDMDVSRTNPWQNIQMKEKDKELLSNGASAYAVAVGLALRTQE